MANPVELNPRRSRAVRALLAAVLLPFAGGAAGAEPVPDPSLAPEDVVRIQLEALRDNDASDRGIAITFRFASPANRQSTGPLPRFARMIKSGVYRLMLHYREAEFAPIEVNGDLASQRVTLIAPSMSVTYVFHLTRQRRPECEGCWMTDAVTVESVDSRAA